MTRVAAPVPFQRLLDAERDVVWRFLVAAVGREAAEDCFQETFLAALRAWPRTGAALENPRAWILTIAQRKTIDHHRARGRRPVPVGAVPDGRAPLDSPALRLEGDAWERARALPPKQRAAVLLRVAGELSHAEIATALGCSEEAARRSVHEAFKRLRKELEQ
jgi:DNA-directed RNA polymerase specialized sigma24 family protein